MAVDGYRQRTRCADRSQRYRQIARGPAGRQVRQVEVGFEIGRRDRRPAGVEGAGVRIVIVGIRLPLREIPAITVAGGGSRLTAGCGVPATPGVPATFPGLPAAATTAGARFVRVFTSILH